MSQSKYLITATSTANSIVLRDDLGSITTNSIYLDDQVQALNINAFDFLGLGAAFYVNGTQATIGVPTISDSNISALSFTAGIDGINVTDIGIISGSYNDLGLMGSSQDLSFHQYNNLKITAGTTSIAITQTTSVRAGTLCTLIIQSSTSTTARTLTFNSSYFRTTGTLATAGTGTLSRTYTISFIADGTKLNEISRTTAMTT